MKTLLLNGAPQKHGHTSFLLQQLMASLPGTIDEFVLFSNPVKPCNDCGFCRQHKGCSIQDNMQDIYSTIQTHDLVVIASPIYYHNLAPPLLSVLSRFQCYFDDTFQIIPQGKPKKGILVMSGGQGKGAETAKNNAYLMFKTMNAQPIGAVQSLYTDSIPASQDPSIEQQIQQLVQSI